jgi:hypothetical protein
MPGRSEQGPCHLKQQGPAPQPLSPWHDALITRR